MVAVKQLDLAGILNREKILHLPSGNDEHSYIENDHLYWIFPLNMGIFQNAIAMLVIARLGT